jgi:hypothetical protein
MTSPFKDVFGEPIEPIKKANWLGRYLDVQKGFDKKLFTVLSDCVKEIDKSFDNLLNDNISTGVRRAQLDLTHKSIRSILKDLFGEVGDLIRDHRKTAAVAAVDAGLWDERTVLNKIFPDPINRQNYADSLRQTAQRNIESVITRVLTTEMPLSRRVWKTEAISNGYVSKAINNGLARGDSAANIAANVRGLVNPSVPGGISYASKRLGRTEINNAFHAQSIQDAVDHPWVKEMEWHLSKVHKHLPGDLCEVYALNKTFNKEDVPEKPHPQCMCFVTPKLTDWDSFETSLLSGEYDPYLEKQLGTNYDKIVDYSPISEPKPNQISRNWAQLNARESIPAAEDIMPGNIAFDKVAPELISKIPNLDECTNVNQVSDYLRERLKIGTQGFTENTDFDSVLRLGHSVDDLHRKYPGVNIKTVAIQDRSLGVFATTVQGEGNSSGINMFIGKTPGDAKIFKDHMAKAESLNFHPFGCSNDPVKDVYYHEFGHAMQNSVGLYYRPYKKEVLKAFNDAWQKTDQSVPLNEWISKGLPGSVFDNWTIFNREKVHPLKDLNIDEALAEAFDDVERNGDAASGPAKALHDLLVDVYKKRMKNVKN